MEELEAKVEVRRKEMENWHHKYDTLKNDVTDANSIRDEAMGKSFLIPHSLFLIPRSSFPLRFSFIIP
jgi:hypothetical protein